MSEKEIETIVKSLFRLNRDENVMSLSLIFSLFLLIIIINSANFTQTRVDKMHGTQLHAIHSFAEFEWEITQL